MNSGRLDMLAEEATEAQIINTKKTELVTSGIESTDIGFIFALKEYSIRMLEGLGHVILYPIVAGTSIIKAILAWREASLGNYQDKSILLKAVIETAAALAITVAVIGLFAASLTFATIAPIIFTITLGTKTLYHLLAAGYYDLISLTIRNPEEKTVYQEKADAHALAGGVNLLTTLAVLLALVLHKMSYAVLGIIGGALGAGYAIYKAATLTSPTPSTTEEREELLKNTESKLKSKPAPLSTQSPSIALSTVPSANTTLPTSTATVTPPLPRITQIKKSSTQQPESEQEKLAKIHRDLDKKAEQINDKMERLERMVGADNVFSSWSRHFNYSNHSETFSLVHWEIFKRKCAHDLRCQSIVQELDDELRTYNTSVHGTKTAVKQEIIKKHIQADIRQKQLADQKEEQNAERRRRGMPTDEDLALLLPSSQQATR